MMVIKGFVVEKTPDPKIEVHRDRPKHWSNDRLPEDPEGDPGMNDQRAYWALIALHAFADQTGVDPEDAICDLVGDLMHLCDRDPRYGSFLNQVRRGKDHYRAETSGKGKQLK